MSDATNWPQDLIEKAFEICEVLGIPSRVLNCQPIIEALLAEREAQRERDAKIAERFFFSEIGLSGQSISIESLEQILHDPENQPSQFGTVPASWVRK